MDHYINLLDLVMSVNVPIFAVSPLCLRISSLSPVQWAPKCGHFGLILIKEGPGKLTPNNQTGLWQVKILVVDVVSLGYSCGQFSRLPLTRGSPLYLGIFTPSDASLRAPQVEVIFIAYLAILSRSLSLFLSSVSGLAVERRPSIMDHLNTRAI